MTIRPISPGYQRPLPPGFQHVVDTQTSQTSTTSSTFLQEHPPTERAFGSALSPELTPFNSPTTTNRRTSWDKFLANPADPCPTSSLESLGYPPVRHSQTAEASVTRSTSLHSHPPTELAALSASLNGKPTVAANQTTRKANEHPWPPHTAWSQRPQPRRTRDRSPTTTKPPTTNANVSNTTRDPLWAYNFTPRDESSMDATRTRSPTMTLPTYRSTLPNTSTNTNTTYPPHTNSSVSTPDQTASPFRIQSLLNDTLSPPTSFDSTLPSTLHPLSPHLPFGQRFLHIDSPLNYSQSLSGNNNQMSRDEHDRHVAEGLAGGFAEGQEVIERARLAYRRGKEAEKQAATNSSTSEAKQNGLSLRARQQLNACQPKQMKSQGAQTSLTLDRDYERERLELAKELGFLRQRRMQRLQQPGGFTWWLEFFLVSLMGLAALTLFLSILICLFKFVTGDL